MEHAHSIKPWGLYNMGEDDSVIFHECDPFQSSKFGNIISKCKREYTFNKALFLIVIFFTNCHLSSLIIMNVFCYLLSWILTSTNVIVSQKLWRWRKFPRWRLMQHHIRRRMALLAKTNASHHSIMRPSLPNPPHPGRFPH